MTLDQVKDLVWKATLQLAKEYRGSDYGRVYAQGMVNGMAKAFAEAGFISEDEAKDIGASSADYLEWHC